VAQLACRAAARLGMSGDERRSIETAARLHDIGEIGIPDEWLGRAGPLLEGELEVVRSHAVMGARLLEPLGGAAAYVRSHHERPDGTGYPDRLREDEIPLGAAVIGVAEAYDAMTHARPYRPSVSPFEARREILRVRGTQFLPRAVDAVLEALPA
jgi:HD-GYP domain-containing protein (c-di-GMP phosphodiesterase class II)